MTRNRHGHGQYEKTLVASQPAGTVRVEGPGEHVHDVSDINAHCIETAPRKIVRLKDNNSPF